MQARRWFWVGTRDTVRDAVAAACGGPPSGEPLSLAGDGDMVIVDALAGGAVAGALPHGHVFSGVRALKDRKGLTVHVVVAIDDLVGVQLARFCLADGVLLWHHDASRLDAGELTAIDRRRRRPPLDELLRRIEQQAAANAESPLQRLLQFEGDDSLLRRLQDPETGLYDGAFATLKLDEEWKRAHRFHSPLALMLVDLGADSAAATRPELLAEAAGVFLNECRDIDILARFSPNVFMLLLPGTGAEGALVLAERIVAALRDRLAAWGVVRPVVGIGAIPSADIPDRRTLLAVAEACLRRAQALGTGGVSASWQ